jgi:hypothetical protein
MRKSFFVLCIFLMFTITACNLPGGSSDPSINDQAATIVAMTLQAATTPTPQTILNTPTAISIVTKSGGPATLTVTDNTNCRSGPGKNYARLTTIPAGTTVSIVARFATGSFWFVTPADGSANCWVDGTLGTVNGDTATLPEVTPVASENKGAPQAPTFLKDNGWTYFCYGTGQTDIALNWKDNANNETGYRVYRNNELIVEFPANATQFSETINLSAGQSVTYKVVAFNEAGEASSKVVTLSC